MAHPNASDCMGRQERATAMIERTGHHMARGGAMRHDDAALDKKAIVSAVHAHERHDHPGKPLTKLKAGGSVEGAASNQHLGRRARGGRTGKKSTHVNVIVAPQGGGMHPPTQGPVPVAAAPRPAMPPPAAPAPAPAMAAPQRPPMSPPPGGGIMPPAMGQRPAGMMKRGGGIKTTSEAGVPSESLLQAKRGGHVKRRAMGGGSDDEKDWTPAERAKWAAVAAAVRRDQAKDAYDNEMSPGNRASGGRVHMEAGAGGGEGRIEKMHEYGEGGFKPKDRMPKMPRRAA